MKVVYVLCCITASVEFFLPSLPPSVWLDASGPWWIGGVGTLSAEKVLVLYRQDLGLSEVARMVECQIPSRVAFPSSGLGSGAPRSVWCTPLPPCSPSSLEFSDAALQGSQAMI